MIKNMMGLPATGINGLGCVYVCGRSLVPTPATGMMTFIIGEFIFMTLRLFAIHYN
jgi:hypothetical protein